VVDEGDPLATDPELDLFDERNGAPYSAEFVTRYRSAQIARNHGDHRLGRDRTQTGFRPQASPTAPSRSCAPGRPADGGSGDRAHQAAAQPVLRRSAGEGQPLRARYRRRLHTAKLAGDVESEDCADPCGASPGPHHLPRPGDQRPSRTPGCSRRTPSGSTTDSPAPTRPCASIDTGPLLHDARGAQRAGGYHREVDRQAVAVRVLAHFPARRNGTGDRCARIGLARRALVPRGRRGDPAPANWPNAEVIWHVLAARCP